MYSNAKNYKYIYKSCNLNNKSEAALYELALRRGQTRGWYPEDWTINDYKDYLFGNNSIKNQS